MLVASQSVVQPRSAIPCRLQRPRMHRQSQEPSLRGRVWQRRAPKQSIQQWRGQLHLPFCSSKSFATALPPSALQSQGSSAKAAPGTRVPEVCMPCGPTQQDVFDSDTSRMVFQVAGGEFGDPNELRCAVQSLSGEEYLQASPTQLPLAA